MKFAHDDFSTRAKGERKKEKAVVVTSVREDGPNVINLGFLRFLADRAGSAVCYCLCRFRVRQKLKCRSLIHRWTFTAKFTNWKNSLWCSIGFHTRSRREGGVSKAWNSNLVIILPPCHSSEPRCNGGADYIILHPPDPSMVPPSALLSINLT